MVFDVSGWLTVISAIGNVGGLALLVFLFSTNRIRTRGQHDAELARERTDHQLAIESLNAYHAALLTVKDAAYSELKESRNYYRDARLEEKGRADKVTDQLAESLELTKLATHLLNSFNEAAKDTTR